MFTQCVYCETVYPLPPRLLAEGRGRIVCGHCEREFDALDRLRETDDYSHRPLVASGLAPRLDSEPAPEQGDLFRLTPIAAVRAPGFVEAHVRPARAWLGWAASAMMLAGLLFVQIVAAERAELAADARWRPWLESVCVHLRCDLPPWREPQRLQLLAREIGPHPSAPDALLVTATIRNPGPWRQAWPQLELSLSDLDGRALALRRFTATEYLGGAPAVDFLAADEAVLLRLELEDPGKLAVAFAFEFR